MPSPTNWFGRPIGLVAVGRHRVRQEQLEERDIGVRPQLTGKANGRIRRADPAKHERLAL
jgi:hypothetical protein